MSNFRGFSLPPYLASRMLLGIALSFTAAFCYASAGYIASELVGVYAAGTTIAFFEALFGFLFVFSLRLGALRQARIAGSQSWQRPPMSATGWLVLASVATAIGVGSFYTALSLTTLSIAAPVSGTAPLVTYALVLVLLRGEERLTMRAVFGAALVVAGVVIIGMNN